MKNLDMAKGVETSFFRDFVDNNDLRLGNALLTEDGRAVFNRVKFWVGICTRDVVRGMLDRRLSLDREGKLLKMAMFQHAVSQVLSEIAMEEDNRTSPHKK